MTNEIPNKLSTIIDRVRDEDMAIFVGKNWHQYQPTWQALKNNDKKNISYMFSNFNWLALLAAPVWFVYRKMYLTMLAYFLLANGLQVILEFFTKDSVTALGVALAVAAMQSSRIIYLTVNARRVLEIRNSGGNEETIQQNLALAGGVSNVALAIGLLITGLITAALLMNMPKTSGQDLNKMIDTMEKQRLENQPKLDQPTDGSIIPQSPNVQIK